MALTNADLPKLIELLNQIDIRVQGRRKTAADWATSNEVLLAGEEGIETDTGWRKTGDGVTGWNSLLYTGWGRLSTPPADGEVPIWDDANGRWAPGTPSGGGSSDWALVKKKTATNRANTTVMTDDPDLVIAIPGAGRWVVQGRVWINLGSQTAGINWQMAFSGTSANNIYYRNNYPTNGGAPSVDNDTTFCSTGLPSGGGNGNTWPNLTTYFELVLNATSAGTLSFQWAQFVSNANNTQIRAGSWLRYSDFT